jgi:hypothetical protein
MKPQDWLAFAAALPLRGKFCAEFRNLDSLQSQWLHRPIATASFA